MKTNIQLTKKRKVTGLFLTTSMLFCLTAGWFFGSATNEAFSQSAKHNTSDNSEGILLPALAAHGEVLPTIILREFSVVSAK